MRNSSLLPAIVITVPLAGATIWYLSSKPKNLEKYFQWKGLSLVKGDKEESWKPIYEANKGDFKATFSVGSEVKDTDYWKTIKDYCFLAYQKTDYYSDIEKATKWCVKK